ncbi:hypothetical protein BJ742DRAFT_817528 [Cladochytrium replicatum]|nr:hypothetical protein BJ742DRAFT_817528 [Cladochytrium replicatum]
MQLGTYSAGVLFTGLASAAFSLYFLTLGSAVTTVVQTCQKVCLNPKLDGNYCVSISANQTASFNDPTAVNLCNTYRNYATLAVTDVSMLNKYLIANIVFLVVRKC